MSAWRFRIVHSYYAVLTVAGTYLWYKPYNATLIKVQLWGAGAGGQGGTIGGTGGGHGGQGGCCAIRYLDASVIKTRYVTLIVGAGGAGSAPAVTPLAASPGGNTTFGSFVTAYGGSPWGTPPCGSGGSGLPSVAELGGFGLAGAPDNYSGPGNEYAGNNTGFGADSGSSLFGGGGGGDGGTGYVAAAGFVGGIRGSFSFGGGGAGGLAGGGNAPSCVGTWKGAGGGGCGGGAGTGRGGVGGWAGGGGGGASGYSGSAGYGGTGGCGYAVINAYY